MDKRVLSEQALYFGDVTMPKGWDIDRDKLQQDTLNSILTDSPFPFSKTWDMLNTYISDYVRLYYQISLVNLKMWGNMYKPETCSTPLKNIEAVDLKNSPDFTLLYGVQVKDCNVRIYFDDNRRKGRSWDIELTNNKFIMFPSTNMYYISNNQKDSLNFVHTITYEYI